MSRSVLYWVLTVGLFASGVARAQPVTTIDIVDPSDDIAQPPAGVLCIDVMVGIDPADEWTAAGIRAETANGATLRYRIGTNGLPNLRNPMAGNPVGNRSMFVTCVSDPLDRLAEPDRFQVADCGIACSSPPFPPSCHTTPNLLELAWFRTPEGRVGVSGAVARVAIDLPPGISSEQVTLSVGTATPPPSHPLALLTSVRESSDAGTVNATVMFPGISGVNWVVSAVPEASSVFMFALGVLVVFRRG